MNVGEFIGSLVTFLTILVSTLAYFHRDINKQIEKIEEEAKRFGLVLSEKNVAEFKRYKEESRTLNTALTGLGVTIGQTLFG